MDEKTSQKVFIVHGHDEAAKHITARFVGKLGLHAVILDEQPSKGVRMEENHGCENSAESIDLLRAG